MVIKIIKVDEEIHNKLFNIRVNKKLKSMSEAIGFLISEHKKLKELQH